MGRNLGRKLRSSWRPLIALVGLAVVVAVIPAVGQETTESTDDAGVLRLHVAGTGNTFFKFEPFDGVATTQDITADRCVIDELEEPPLVDLSAGGHQPGLNGISIGVFSGGSRGVPCGRVDTSEVDGLHLDFLGSRVNLAHLDLELKSNAKVEITVYRQGDGAVETEKFEVRSGSSIVEDEGVDGSPSVPFTLHLTSADNIGNCRNASDSGPDSGPNDNCRVTIDPDEPFTSMSLKAHVGEFSLEGSGDFGGDPAFDTLFLVNFDGRLDCGDDVSATSDGGGVGATIIRHSNADETTCVPKLFALRANQGDENSVTFEIEDPASQPEAFYEAFVTLDQPLTTPLSAVLQYDSEPPYEEADFKDAEACEVYPFAVDENGDDVVDPDGAKTLVDGAIPDGHEACVISVSQEWDGTTVWHAVFQGDWKFR